MGNWISQSQARQEAALSLFSPLEQQHLLRLFDRLAAGHVTISPEAFRDFCPLVPERERIPLFNALRHKAPMDRSTFCVGVSKATRGTPEEKAAILFRWCSRGHRKVRMSRVFAFFTALSSTALGIRPLRSKERYNYVASEGFVTMLLLNLSEETLPQMEQNLELEMTPRGCVPFFPWFRRGRGRIAVESDDDGDDLGDEKDPDDSLSSLNEGPTEKGRLMDGEHIERKKSDGKDRKRGRTRRYNSFDKRTAGVDGDVEEEGDSPVSPLKKTARTAHMATVEETSSLHQLKTENRGKRKVTKQDFKTWAARDHRIQVLFDIVVNRIFLRLKDIHMGEISDPNIVEEQRRLKRERGLNPPILSYHTKILKTEDVWFLSLGLPKPCRHHWRLLYSDLVHGRSWSKLEASILHQGPTLIVVEDTKNYIFGGFASQSWEKKPSFYGDTTSFLFSLRPSLDVFFASHYNNNFQYLNSGTKTLPNGLGMGGQLSYFGFWLDSAFETGHSKANPLSTTFNSPQLSHEESFKIKFVEVWGLVDPLIDPNRETKVRSVLDSNREDRMVLELAGRENYSHNIREPSYGDDD